MVSSEFVLYDEIVKLPAEKEIEVVRKHSGSTGGKLGRRASGIESRAS
jgi:hypothetical protein